MTRAEDLIASITVLNRTDLEIWLREELVTATADGETLVFTEMECARVRLICSLRYELEVETETLPVVMSLLDQLYETRARLLSLTAAVTRLDPEARGRVLAGLAEAGRETAES
ncbi:chaperone modulator CbpM [Amaricoccus sp.]|mgnify:CR=1 FL=1|uniref:chaperone modulator CbpM n=1 Tax=Amaricoccus sp. TaxID=1872485 RepID=UPI002612F694|nr:chaperone modulator CbpM [uncultured Amaricoccus sp.]